MNKILLALLFCSVLTNSKAQNYTPFPENVAVWDIYLRPSESDKYNRYTMQGDTVINNKFYNKIYCSHYSFASPPKFTMTKLGYCFGIRKDIANKKVYRTLVVN